MVVSIEEQASLVTYCKACKKIIKHHTLFELGKCLNTFRGVISIDKQRCTVCCRLKSKHKKYNLVKCLKIASYGSFTGMRRPCYICRYDTLILSTNHDKCSGCGNIYGDIPFDMFSHPRKTIPKNEVIDKW